MRALIYARVSSDPKGRGRSVDEQRIECRALADREGWTVVDELTDNDRSASRHATQTRPAWTAAKEMIATSDIDVLVTWEASRAQRDLGAYVELRELCAAHGVRWAYCGTVYDLSDRSDRYRTGQDALMAEDESERTRERVLRSMRANATSGRPHGKRSYGYRRVYDDSTGELLRQEIEPGEAAIVSEAARRFLAGESARSIANDFNARNVSPPRSGVWDLTRIKRILINPTYNAKRVHQGEVVGPASWPAILDDDTFTALLARFADPARALHRAGPRIHLLSGAARCGVCGGPMRWGREGGTKSKPKIREKYECVTNHCTARDLIALESFVTAVVLERLRRADAREAIAGATTPDPSAVEAMSAGVALRGQLDDAIAEFTAGNLTAATLGRIEADLLPKIAAAERAARVSGLPTAAADVALSDEPAMAWEALTPDQRREVVRSLMDIIVLPVKTRGRKAFDPSTVRIEWKR